ncbi:ABC transporter permease [Paralcaligenes ureilyticus]|uniref:Putative spermidine/putrescine transport system permease protein n=1 Tax=Paralcaligenes ureilyticus TaxID=627131 RepID=A0A4R3LWN3_9BURK|nr:ABC transporter permease [Paralcaligenes ureilyticus]TCT03075.1 putative spermidine/putrescine transport system permease protein [Paralcaligenes ureilyticus]
MNEAKFRRWIERAKWVPLYVFTALFFVYLLAPIVIVVAVSFTPDNGMEFPFSGFSLRWYHQAWEYKPFVDSLIISLELALVSGLAAAFVAVPSALFLGRGTSRMSVMLATFLLSPIAIPALVIGLALLYFLAKIGIGVSFLALFIAHTVVSIPYVMRTTLAVYRNLSPQFAEAASVLGASSWQKFRYVTLPLIAPGIFAGCLFAILISLDNLALSYFFGTANVTTLPVVMLSYLQYSFDPAIAAICTVEMAISIVLLVVVEKVYGLRALISS